MRQSIPSPEIIFYDLPGTASEPEEEVDRLLRDWFQQKGFSISTMRCYRSAVKRFHSWLDKRLCAAGEGDLKRYEEYLAQKNSPRSVQTEVKRVRCFLKNIISD